MSQTPDKVSSLIDVTALSTEAKQSIQILESIKTQLIDTASAGYKLNQILLGSVSFKELAVNSKAVTDTLSNQVKIQDKLAIAEDKAAKAREAAYNKYLAQLAKEQAENDKATAKAVANMQKRLSAIDQETAKIEQAAAKRRAVTAQDPATYRGADVVSTGGNGTAMSDDAAALSNERAALIASIEAENMSTAARVVNTEAITEENTALLQNIENNLRLKAELEIVNAEIKTSSTVTAEMVAEQLRLTAAITENNATIKTQIAQEIAAKDSDVAKAARLRELTLAYTQLSEEEKLNAEVGGKLKAEIDGLTPTVEANRQALGNYTGQVGNYTNGIDRALARFSSFDKIAGRIINSLGRQLIGMATGFLSFALGAKAIELLIGFLAKLAEQYNIFGTKLTQAKANLEALNEVNKKASEEAGKQIADMKILVATATDVTNSHKQRLDAAKELIKLYPEELKNVSALAIANGQEKDALDKLTVSIIDNAKASAARGKIQEIEAKRLELQFEKAKVKNAEINELARSKKEEANGAYDMAGTGEAGGGGILAGNNEDKIHKRAVEAIQEKDAADKLLAGQEDFLVKYAGGAAKIAAVIEKTDKTKKPKAARQDNSDVDALKAQADAFKAVAENIQNSEEVREVALNKLLEVQNQIADLSAKKRLKLGENADQVEKLRLAEHAKNQLAFSELEEKIYEDEYNRVHKIIEDNLKEFLALQQRYSEDQLNQLATNLTTQELALSDKYKTGLMKEEEYQKAKYDLTKSYNKLVLEEEIRALTLRIASNKAAGNDTEEDERKLAGLKVNLTKQSNDEVIKSNEDEGKKAIELKKKEADEVKSLEKQAFDQVVTSVENIVNAKFEASKKQIEDQKTQIDTDAQNQIDAENKSLDSTKQKADKIALINARAQQQKNILDAKARKEAVAQAKFERELNVIKIVENTAVGIMNAIADFPFPFSLVVGAALGAIGAIEIAEVLSTPLPAFKHGGTVKRDGLVIAGEIGTELKIDPDGTLGLTPGQATVMQAKAGTKFIDHDKTMKILAQPERANFVGGQALDISELIELNKAMLGEMKKDKRTHVFKGNTQNYNDWRSIVNNYIN